MREKNIFIYCLILLLFVFSSCKKKPTENKFEKFIGNWSCSKYLSISGARNNSKIETKYEMGSNGKLYYSSTIPDTGSSGNYKTTNDIYEFDFRITTHLEDGSKLVIDEVYNTYKNNSIYKTFKYLQTIQLVDGISEYKISDNSML